MKNTKDINNASDGTFIRQSKLNKINRILNGEEDLSILDSLELRHLGETPFSVFKNSIKDDGQKSYFYGLYDHQEIFWKVAQALVDQETDKVPKLEDMIEFEYKHDYDNTHYDYTPCEIAQEFIQNYKTFNSLVTQKYLEHNKIN